MTLKKMSVLAIGGFLLACAQQPAEELEAARQAVEEARASEAPIYAPDEFETAEQSLREAEAEIAAQDDSFALTRSYDTANDLLSQARTAAEEATSASAANREEIRSQAEEAVQEAEQAIDSAAEALTSAPRGGKGTGNDIEALETSLETSRESLDRARQLLQDESFMDALNQARSAQSGADRVTSEIEQAIQRRGGR